MRDGWTVSHPVEISGRLVNRQRGDARRLLPWWVHVPDTAFREATLTEYADPEDGLAGMMGLWSAATPDELHRVLVLHAPIRGSADAFEPFALLRKHHDDHQDQAAETAMLLLTDRRWRGGVHQLMRRIAEADVLDREQLDLLAQVFLAADDAVYWRVPDHWFEGGFVIELTQGGEEGDEGPDDDPVGPTVARREISPPLRRWAAAHVLEREPSTWARLIARTDEVSARHAAAIMAGVVERVETLPGTAQEAVIRRAVTWPQHHVRRLALELIAAREGVEAARRLAEADPNARIRVWGADLASGSSSEKPGGVPTLPSDASPSDGGQEALF